MRSTRSTSRWLLCLNHPTEERVLFLHTYRSNRIDFNDLKVITTQPNQCLITTLEVMQKKIFTLR